MAKTWQVILATLAIFVAGLIAGGASAIGVARWIGHRFHPQSQGQRNSPPQFGPQLIRGFADKLDLTVEQRAKIDPIVNEAVANLMKERREVQRASAAIIERMQGQVSEQLTPDQKAKFDELIAQQRERLRRFRESRELGGQPGGPHEGPPEPAK